MSSTRRTQAHPNSVNNMPGAAGAAEAALGAAEAALGVAEAEVAEARRLRLLLVVGILPRLLVTLDVSPALRRGFSLPAGAGK